MDFGGLYDLDPNPKCYVQVGSGFKQERSLSATAHNQDEWRDLKLPKITQQDISKAMLRSNTTSHSAYSDSQNMLSFSSPNTLTLPYYAPNTAGSGSLMAGVRGPFTASQWMELEHQALIYKYITVNAPVPSNLLIPIRKALETAAFSGTHLRNTTYGWGAFHLGFSNSSDPEPGRCRRTDGKKWRCSRDAVADQKYCERHMNRGRHRSRKPVEGQTGHSVSNGPTTTAAVAAAKVSASAAVVTTTSTIVSHLHQLSSSNRMQSFLNKGNEKTEDAIGHSSIGLKQNPSEFGLVCSDSLLNPLQKNEDGGHKSQNSLRQFMDNWPQSDRTQLSISIPIPPSDFMSSTSSPISERLNLSPLRMGLGVGNNSERSQWIPVSWESSMGGPLGEVLNNSPSALSLMTDGWESSQQMTLSPTGVLQKRAFGSLSNSSTGSSPRTGSTTLMTSSLPLM
ncbi:growth-regulating factor 6-like [Cynara cardunculus var. scolymus]|uniref:growth-regulating factor 6-like n=1 Tax=Cynara cardunculus var. scolymus TaxID=59895 RepID=UPI000D62C94A|nr:growth-regulating factor 6-like [Cynara cardunculus var. scolymus]